MPNQTEEVLMVLALSHRVVHVYLPKRGSCYHRGRKSHRVRQMETYTSHAPRCHCERSEREPHFPNCRRICQFVVHDLHATPQTTIFGVKYRSPVCISPVGVQGLLHPEGELATARAARNLGVPFIMSTAATRSIEAVAEANGDGHRWFQLYW